MRTAIGRGVWLAAGSHLVIETCNNYLPVLYPVLMQRMELGFTQVGLIALVASTAVTLAQPVFGYLADRWRSEWMTPVTMIWIGVAMGLVGVAPSFGVLLTLIILGSLGSAAFHPVTVVLAAGHSGSKPGSGLSIFSVGGSVGMALSPLWMGLAFAALGDAGTLTIVPLGVAGGLYVLWQLGRLRRQDATVTRSSHKPAAGGFLAGLVLIIVAMMFRSWFQIALSTYLPVWIQQNGGTVAFGGQVLSVLLFATSFGSLVGGSLGDRFGYWQVLLVCALVMPGALWVFLTFGGWSGFIALAVCGIAIGATFPTSIVLAMNAWPSRVGLASGLIMGLAWWPGGLGASVTGMIADRVSLTVALQALVFAPVLTSLFVVLYAALARSRRTPAAVYPTQA